MKKIFSLFAAILFAGSLMAANLTIDFEATSTSTYSDWTFTDITTHNTNSNVKAHGGSYFGTTNSKANASVQTKNKVNPESITFYVTKQTTNTTACYWTVSVSSNGTSWTTVGDQQSASSMSRGNWVEVTRDLSAYSDVYVRVAYGTSSTAVRCIDDLTLVLAGAVKAPTFTPSEGNFENSVSVGLACETADAAIYYTTKESAKGTPATSGDWAAYDKDNKPSFSATTTIWAAAKKGDDWSSVASKTYTKVGIFSCDEIRGLAEDAEAHLNDVKVTYVSGRQVWIQDASGATQLYLPANAEWEVGNDLAGLQGTVKLFNGARQIQPSADQVAAVSATTGSDPVPVQFTAAPTSDDQHKYVVFNNVLVSTASFTSSSASTTTTLTIGEDEVTLLNNFKKTYSFADGTHYNVVGIVNYNEKADPEVRVYFVSAEEKECESKITITKADNPEHGTFILNNSGEVCIEYGNASTTVTATPDEHYHLATVTSTFGTVGAISNNQCTITDIDANTTIAVEFEEDAKSIVTWNVNGDETLKTNVYNGEKPVFPATPAAFEVNSADFYGWATSTWSGKLENLNDKTVYTKAEDMPEVDGAVTYYAVFAKKSSALQPKEKDYSFTISSKTWDAEGDKTLEGVTWTLADDGGYYGNDGDRGQQVGSGGSPASTMSLSTSGISGTINSVKVYTSGGKDVVATVSVSVGGVAYKSGENESESLTATNTAYTFEGSKEGEIEIAWAQTSSKALYFKQVEVNYTVEETVDTYADYVTTSHAVTIAATTNGTVKVKNGGVEITSGDKFAVGTELTIETTPNKGFKVNTIDVMADGNPIVVSKEGVFTVTAAEEIVVTVTFTEGTTAVDNTEVGEKVVKSMENGVLIIRRGDKTYNGQGQLVK